MFCIAFRRTQRSGDWEMCLLDQGDFSTEGRGLLGWVQVLVWDADPILNKFPTVFLSDDIHLKLSGHSLPVEEMPERNSGFPFLIVFSKLVSSLLIFNWMYTLSKA